LKKKAHVKRIEGRGGKEVGEEKRNRKGKLFGNRVPNSHEMGRGKKNTLLQRIIVAGKR